MLAVRRLHDGHTSASSIGDFVLRNQKPKLFDDLENHLTHLFTRVRCAETLEP